MGSLYTALASYLDARAHQGKWLIRIDDLDTPRNVPGSAEQILKTLAAFGLHWDEPVAYQTRHIPYYQEVLNELADRQLLYPCTCSRKSLADLNLDTDLYPGICRDKKNIPDQPYALRIRAAAETVRFHDLLQGEVSHEIASQDGDFILQRKDRIIAYQFAVVIDDYLQQVNHIVRGSDLLAATPRQIYLQQLLQLPTPDYAHLPVLVDETGYKLSKQTRAAPVDPRQPGVMLFKLLELLNQHPPVGLKSYDPETILSWAVENWAIENLTQLAQLKI